MSRRQRLPAVLRAANIRQGEGVAVEVTKSLRVSTDGKTSTALGINLASVPVPERKYLADIFQVTQSDSSVRLLFAQRRIDQGLRSLLIIHLGGETVQNFLESLPDGKHGKQAFEDVAKIGDGVSIQPAKIDLEPAQTIALKANGIYAAMTGSEACMDFYQVSPASIVAAKEASAIGVEPVVRVDLSAAMLLGICEEFRKIHKKSQDVKSLAEAS